MKVSKQIVLAKFILAVFLLASQTTLVNAQSYSRLGGDLTDAQSRFSSLENSSTFGSSAKLNFDLTDPNFGSLTVSFSEQPSQNRSASFRSGTKELVDSASVILLKGNGVLNGISIPVAGSIYRENGAAALHINFIAPSSNFSSNATPVEVTQKLTGGIPLVEIPKQNALQGKKCGTELLPVVSAPTTSTGLSSSSTITANSVTANSVKIIDIATEADYEYYLRYGSATNSRIASIINSAQVIYERDLGLRFNIVRQRVRTTSSQPYTSSDSDVLLEQLTTEVSNSGGLRGADLVHLFTGKDLTDNIVGLAWLGVVCTTPRLSTGLTQAISSSIDPIIFAHETGHNLGADHDSGLPKSLMFPMAGSDQTFLSQRSKNDINSHFASGGEDCLSSATSDTPTPSPTASPTPKTEPVPPSNGGGGGGTSGPKVGFSVEFNQKKGVLVISLSRSNISEGICTARVRIGSNSKLTNAGGVEFDSSATTLVFTSKSTKRLSSSRSRIFFDGEFINCPGDEAVRSASVDINPIASRATRKSDRVSSTAWIDAVIQKMTVREK